MGSSNSKDKEDTEDLVVPDVLGSPIPWPYASKNNVSGLTKGNDTKLVPEMHQVFTNHPFFEGMCGNEQAQSQYIQISRSSVILPYDTDDDEVVQCRNYDMFWNMMILMHALSYKMKKVRTLIYRRDLTTILMTLPDLPPTNTVDVSDDESESNYTGDTFVDCRTTFNDRNVDLMPLSMHMSLFGMSPKMMCKTLVLPRSEQKSTDVPEETPQLRAPNWLYEQLINLEYYIYVGPNSYNNNQQSFMENVVDEIHEKAFLWLYKLDKVQIQDSIKPPPNDIYSKCQLIRGSFIVQRARTYTELPGGILGGNIIETRSNEPVRRLYGYIQEYCIEFHREAITNFAGDQQYLNKNQPFYYNHHSCMRALASTNRLNLNKFLLHLKPQAFSTSYDSDKSLVKVVNDLDLFVTTYIVILISYAEYTKNYNAETHPPESIYPILCPLIPLSNGQVVTLAKFAYDVRALELPPPFNQNARISADTVRSILPRIQAWVEINFPIPSQ